VLELSACAPSESDGPLSYRSVAGCRYRFVTLKTDSTLTNCFFAWRTDKLARRTEDCTPSSCSVRRVSRWPSLSGWPAWRAPSVVRETRWVGSGVGQGKQPERPSLSKNRPEEKAQDRVPAAVYQLRRRRLLEQAAVLEQPPEPCSPGRMPQEPRTHPSLSRALARGVSVASRS